MRSAQAEKRAVRLDRELYSFDGYLGISPSLLQYQKGQHAVGEADAFDRLGPLPRCQVMPGHIFFSLAFLLPTMRFVSIGC